MALLLAKSLASRASATARLWSPAVASRMTASHWNKDWKPAPYPKTEADKVAAAKKYGMIREDYEPFPDDGNGWGDYPMLPVKSHYVRDPFYPWDYPEFRRDHQEPLHMENDIYGFDRIDHGRIWNPPMPLQVAIFIGFFGGFALFIYLTNYYQHFMPEYEKEWGRPQRDGRPKPEHFSFDPKGTHHHGPQTTMECVNYK